MKKKMDIITLEWKARYWRMVRDILGMTTSEVYLETGIDPYDFEYRIRSSQSDKTRLAYFYNRLLREEGSEYRMATQSSIRRAK